MASKKDTHQSKKALTFSVMLLCVAMVTMSAVAAEAPLASSAWSYTRCDDRTGIDHWSEYWEIGDAQSPINISTGSADSGGVLPSLAYKSVAFTVINNGHTVQLTPANPAEAGYIKIGDKQYDFVQAHFHAASEHTIDGVYYPIEMHMVHQNPTSKEMAVLGILFKEGEACSTLDELFCNLPQTSMEDQNTFTLKNGIDMSSIIPQSDAFQYTGSLTTPPCTEGVYWTVYSGIVQLSATQIDAFRALYSNNYRPVQPLNGRKITNATK